MTATDELRRMLDERGVEWDELSNEDGDRITRWKDANGRYVSALDCGETRYLADFYWGPTPQQAIEATLGDTDATAERRGDAGTCRDEGDPGDFCCSECGVRMFTDTSDTYTMIASDGRTIIKHPNYCPNCGRKVEQ